MRLSPNCVRVPRTSEQPDPVDMNRYLAELIGTFALVFAGCGAIVVDQLYGASLGVLGIGLVFGLIVMAMIYAIGNISGAHINPAVSIAFYIAGRFPARELLPYVLAQCSGAILACLLLLLIMPGSETLGATAPVAEPWRAAVMEVVLSFMLMFIILNVSTGHQEKGIMAGVAIGGFVALAATFGGPVSGASMNPARSMGPAIVSMNLDHLWIYLGATTLGTVLATPFCRWVQGPDCCPGEQIAEQESVS